MSTVRDLIKGSLRLIGAIASGETPSAAEEADALSSLNSMLGSWSTEGLAIYKYDREVFALVSGQSKYTMGATGNFNTTRPMRIAQASASDARIVVTVLTPFIPGNPAAMPTPIPDVPATYRTDVYSVNEMPVKILNIQEWAGIQSKEFQSQYVQSIFCEGTAPLETINVYPVPSVASALVLYSQKLLTVFTNVSNVVDFPPGYEEAIKFNLALRLAPEFGKQSSPEVAAFASEAKANIKRQNTQPVYIKSDAFGLMNRKRFNIITGE